MPAFQRIGARGAGARAVSLAVGMAQIFSGLPGMKGLMDYWYHFAIMFEALFILTTIDAGTRVARFLVQEFFGHFYKPFARTDWMPGTFISTGLVVFGWGYFIWTGSIGTIWPMFGVSNQLLAAIAFGVGTTVIIKSGKAEYAWTTLVPMLFMFTTTLTASWELIMMFMDKAAKASSAADAFTFKVDAGLVALMALLAVISLIDMLVTWYGYFSEAKKLPSRSSAAKPATLLTLNPLIFVRQE